MLFVDLFQLQVIVRSTFLVFLEVTEELDELNSKSKRWARSRSVPLPCLDSKDCWEKSQADTLFYMIICRKRPYKRKVHMVQVHFVHWDTCGRM